MYWAGAPTVDRLKYWHEIILRFPPTHFGGFFIYLTRASAPLQYYHYYDNLYECAGFIFIYYGVELTLEEDLLLEGVDRSEVAVAVKAADIAAFLRRVVPAQQRVQEMVTHSWTLKGQQREMFFLLYHCIQDSTRI